MEQSLLTVLPQLSIGVVAVLSLVYIAREFIKSANAVQAQHREETQNLHLLHLAELKEQQKSHRELEKEVRDTIMGQLSVNTTAMQKMAFFMETKQR